MTRAEFEQQVRLNQEPLRRFLINLCHGNTSLADDIAREAFIKAYLNLGNFFGKSKFSTWLFKIAYNCFCDDKRVSQRYSNTEISEGKLYGSDNPDERYRNQELYMALSKLNETRKAVFCFSIWRINPLKR